MSAKTLTVMAVLAFVSLSVDAQDEDATSCQCAVLVTTGVLVTAFVILAVFGLFLFIKRRTQAEARKPDPEAAVGAAYTNPGFEEDNTDGGPASSSRPSAAAVLSDPASPNKSRDKGLSTLERVMAAVKLSSRDSPTRTLDDTGSVGAGEEAVVPLRATDFAGLGFTVAGTLRDGIYVKDLLNKGPAALSGNVKPGDRLVALTVVTEHCAQDDALNLLSYASPYPVLLHLVKNSATRQTGLGLNLSTLSSSPSNLSASEKKASAPAASMPVHPSFRSQSSGDLTSIAPGDDRKASRDLKLGGCIESPHTRISDSAINQLAGCQLTRSKMQGRHSERAIDVPETALKPSSAYGKLHPSSHSIQDVVIDIQGNDSESRETMMKLGVKVLPDLPNKIQTNSINIEQVDVAKGSEISDEDPKTGDSAGEGLGHVAVEVTHPIVEIHSEMNSAIMNNHDEQEDASLDTKGTLKTDFEPNSECEGENEDVISNLETNLPSVINNSTQPSDTDHFPDDPTENTITSRSVVREQQTYAPTTDLTSPMMTDDEASRPTTEIEPVQNTVLLFSVPETDPHIQAIRPRTDDEKQNARRSLGFEFIGMRNFHRDSSALEESPECDENKIRMDAVSSTLSPEVLETANRAAIDVDDYSVQTGSENTINDQDVENTSGFAMTNLNFIRNKTDQIKDEEHLAINLTANMIEQQEENVELENSDTEDDAAMRIRVYERELEPATSAADGIAHFSSQRDVIRSRPLKRAAVRRVSSPNDRSSIFGMYVNHDFNKLSDSPTEKLDYCDENNSAVTGTKPKTIASMASASRSNQEECFASTFTRNDSYRTAKQLFTTKSEVELTTDIQKDNAENREHTTEKLITTSFDTRVNLPDDVVESVDAGTFETFNDPGISVEKRKISLLNFEISKPKRSTLEIEMKSSSESKDPKFLTYRTIKSDSIEHANEENEIGNQLKNKIESDLPEADSDLNNASLVTRVINLTDKMNNRHSVAGAEWGGVVSNDTTADEAEGFGVAFGFKGFKKRIGRGEFISKIDDENFSGDSNEPGNTNESKFITVNEVGKTSVSSLKMSFEQLRGSEEEVRSTAGLQIEDLPESEASFSRAFDANQNQPASPYIDDATSSYSSEMGEREHLQNEEISFNISRGDLNSDYDTRHGVSDDTKYISSIQENSKEGSKRGSRLGSKNRNYRLSNPEYVSFGNRDEIDEDHGSPKKKLKQSQSFGFKQKITDPSSITAAGDDQRSSMQENKIKYESRPILHYIDSKQRILFENRDRMDAETQLDITKSDLEPRILTRKSISKIMDTYNENRSSDDRELLNNNDEISGQKQSSKIHNRQRTPDSADDSDEEMMSLAAAAAIANRRPKSVAKSGLNSCILKKNAQENEPDTFRQYIDSLVTGSVDVQIPPDGASKFEVMENIQAVRIDNDADLVPVSVTGLNPVTISGTFLDEKCDTSINFGKEAIDSAPFNLIRIASDYKVLQKSQSHSNFERHAKMNDANAVSIQQIQMKQNGSGSDTENDQITISNTRRSLTDSEELKRKAASLGDLSQIPDRQDESVLERAVSLEFGSTNEHNSSSPLHKHRINLPTSSVTSVDEEEERESMTLQNNPSFDEGNTKITKWGNLDDAILLHHHTGKEALPNGNGNLVSVQTYRRRDYKASSLEGIPSSVERSNSTKLEVNQPNVTVRSNPTLSMSTVEVPATNLEVNFNAKSIDEIGTPEGGPISNIEISGDHGVSITSLSHSATTWVRDEEENPPALPSSPAPLNSNSTRDMLGATTIRVLENSPTVDSRVLVVDNNHDYEDQTFVPHSKQKQNSLLLNSKNFINDSESEVTVTTVLGSGKTSFITGSSPPDLVSPKNLSHEGDWVHTNGDIINVSKHDGHNLAHLENNRNESSKGMTHSDRENDSGYLSHPSDPDQIMQMSMTQIRVDGTRLDYGRDDKRLSRTLVIPPPGTSAAISITQPDSPPPFLQPPY